MITKISPLRAFVASLFICVAAILLFKTFSETNGFHAVRFFGIGLAMMISGSALLIFSSKDIYHPDGRKVTFEEIKKGLLATPNTSHVSAHGIISPADAMQESVEYISELETIKPLPQLGACTIGIGAVMALVSFVTVLFF